MGADSKAQDQLCNDGEVNLDRWEGEKGRTPQRKLLEAGLGDPSLVLMYMKGCTGCMHEVRFMVASTQDVARGIKNIWLIALHMSEVMGCGCINFDTNRWRSF